MPGPDATQSVLSQHTPEHRSTPSSSLLSTAEILPSPPELTYTRRQRRVARIHFWGHGIVFDSPARPNRTKFFRGRSRIPPERCVSTCDRPRIRIAINKRGSEEYPEPQRRAGDVETRPIASRNVVPALTSHVCSLPGVAPRRARESSTPASTSCLRQPARTRNLHSCAQPWNRWRTSRAVCRRTRIQAWSSTARATPNIEPRRGRHSRGPRGQRLPPRRTPHPHGPTSWGEPVDLVLDGVGGHLVQRGVDNLAVSGRLVAFSAGSGTIDAGSLLGGLKSVIVDLAQVQSHAITVAGRATTAAPRRPRRWWRPSFAPDRQLPSPGRDFDVRMTS